MERLKGFSIFGLSLQQSCCSLITSITRTQSFAFAEIFHLMFVLLRKGSEKIANSSANPSTSKKKAQGCALGGTGKSLLSQ
jgi:hypothetical protein